MSTHFYLRCRFLVFCCWAACLVPWPTHHILHRQFADAYGTFLVLQDSKNNASLRQSVKSQHRSSPLSLRLSRILQDDGEETKKVQSKRRGPSRPGAMMSTSSIRPMDDRSSANFQHRRAGTSNNSNQQRRPTFTKRNANHKPPPKSTSFSNNKTPEQIEQQLNNALKALQRATSSKTDGGGALHMLLFPTVRECNAALKAFGDARDLLRALRLFGKMRKAVLLQKMLQQQTLLAKSTPTTTATTESSFNTTSTTVSLPPPRAPPHMLVWPVPAPTLVTYSTLMSRFVTANKPAVALRLWNLMMTDGNVGELDVRATNILMNAYAKMANVEAAQTLLNAMKNEESPQNSSSRNSNTLYSKVQLPAPNSITYNTFLSACHQAGDLDAAVAAVQDMHARNLPSDARTYTSLMATVARRPSQWAGARDPSPAFQFLQDMLDRGLHPNGRTYSALIDVCGRCGRSDLALQALRTMLRQKRQEQKALSLNVRMAGTDFDPNSYTLANEVGAWTACINACGKSGRWETALKLFYTMPNFGVQPNTITCGCLTDSLLRVGRTAETLDVLRYMKEQRIPPSEVMYTSLMARAGKLVELERQRQWQAERQSSATGEQQQQSPSPQEEPVPWPEQQQQRRRNDEWNAATVFWSDRDSDNDTDNGNGDLEAETTQAIEVYTELIQSLINFSRTNSDSREPSDKRQSNQRQKQEQQPDPKSLLLVKVFLVFQEMKNAGIETIDLPCYHTLLRACAQAGDYARAQEVFRQMEADQLVPNDTTWRLLLRSASGGKEGASSSLGRLDRAVAVWQQGLSYRPPQRQHANQQRLLVDPASAVTAHWKPSVESFAALLSIYMREAAALEDDYGDYKKRCSPEQCYRQVVQLYDDVLLGQNEEMGMDRIDVDLLLDNPKTLLVVVQAIVALDMGMIGGNERVKLRSTAASILQLACFQNEEHIRLLLNSSGRIGWQAKETLQIVRSWVQSVLVP